MSECHTFFSSRGTAQHHRIDQYLWSTIKPEEFRHTLTTALLLFGCHLDNTCVVQIQYDDAIRFSSVGPVSPARCMTKLNPNHCPMAISRTEEVTRRSLEPKVTPGREPLVGAVPRRLARYFGLACDYFLTRPDEKNCPTKSSLLSLVPNKCPAAIRSRTR